MSTFWMEHVKGLARALNDNKTSAQVDLVFATLMVLGSGVGVHLGGIKGTHLAVVLSPFLAALPFGMKLGASHVVGSVVRVGTWILAVWCAHCVGGRSGQRILRRGCVFDRSALVGGR